MTGDTAAASRSTVSITIAGGGIGGLVAALSLAEVGLEVDVYEAVDDLQPLGVGINLLPHAVRELDALGLLDRLAAESVAPTTLAYFTKRGEPIWDEPRGIAAGYRWPQLSIHRGTLHRILLDALLDRLGAERLHLGHRLVAIDDPGDLERPDTAADLNTAAVTDTAVTDTAVMDTAVTDNDTVRATFATADGEVQVASPLLVAADGIHSVGRAVRYPHEGMPKWNGALLWRGLAVTDPVLGGRTMVWAGHPRQKFVGYPVLDLDDGRQLFNFIAELRTDGEELAAREDWNQPGRLEDFIEPFESWRFHWLDVPALIRSAEGTFRFPMVDRDPVDRWTFGRTTLLGDAAHPMYPIGSNGASQAILDARVLAGCLRSIPDDVPAALARYEAERRPATAQIVLANRGLGPELPMQLVEERAPDGFDDLADVITQEEILEVTDGYRRTAGFALEALREGRSLADRDYAR